MVRHGSLSACHPAPYYTDNTLHNLRVQRFFQWPHGLRRRTHQDHHLARPKGFAPFLHEGRLLTLEDTVEFFNLIQETQLKAKEKADLVAFLGLR